LITRIFLPLQTAVSQRCFDELARAAKHRPQQLNLRAQGSSCRDSAQPRQPRPAQDAQKQGFGLVIGMVRGEDALRA